MNTLNITLEDFGWQVLRTPLYPATLGHQDHFFELLKTPLFQQAIYLSSTSLYHSLQKLLEGQLSDKEKKRVTQSLFSYFLRASYRCTPFGLMAGLALGEVDDQTQTVIQDIERHNKIDAEVLYALDHAVSPSPQAKYHPNPTLYAHDQHTQRYFYRDEQHQAKQGVGYQFQYSSVETNEYLDILLGDTSARSQETYVQQLVAENVDPESATEFVQDLIEAQLLQSTHQVSPVGQKLQERILADQAKGQTLLNQIQQAIEVTDYQTIEAKITDILPDLGPYIRNFFHVDTQRHTQCNALGQTLVNQIIRVVQTLHQVIPARFNQSLVRFRQTFNQRYEGQQVPLMELLDPENGILYPGGSALKQPYIFNHLSFPSASYSSSMTLDAWQYFLMETYSKSLLGEKIVKLSSQDLLDKFGQTNAAHQQYPESIGALVSVLGKDKVQLKGLHPGAGTFLGRFTLMDPDLEQAVRQITDYEQHTNPDVIYAEIVHAPAPPKVYNILNRPAHLRHYKLVLFANPNLYPAEEVLLPKDILVSVVNDEIVLRHIPTGKRVIPFLTTAHNQRGSNFPAYNLLCDLAYQNTYVSNWSWGALSHSIFLPRVEIDGVVVSPATWRVKQMEDLSTLNIPQRFWLTLGDRKLLIDQGCALSQQILQEKLRKKNQEITVEEYLFEDYVVTDEQGQGYTNEMVLPLKVTNPRQLRTDFEYAPPIKHFLGDDWVYFKIYCGVFTAEEMLKNYLTPIIDQLGANLQKWFFIRYRDQQGPHIRVRFKVNSLDATVFTAIHHGLEYHLRKGLIRLSFDTYEPEVLRYGGHETLEVCESVFWADSNALVQALQVLEQDKDQNREQYLIALAMKNIDYLLQDFGLDLEQRMKFATSSAQAFAQEFKVGNVFKKRLGKTYRDYQQTLKTLGNAYDAIFDTRSAHLHPLVQQLETLVAEKNSQKSKESLLQSLTHMSLNRLFDQLPRQQEYITWDFLVQFYKRAFYTKAK